MSTRESRLCDFIEFENPCDERARDACPLCKRDICGKHALHPNGGLTLMLALTRPAQGERGADDAMRIPMGESTGAGPDQQFHKHPHVNVFICRDCASGLQAKHFPEPRAAVDLKDVVANLVAAVVDTLAATLAARALETPKRR